MKAREGLRIVSVIAPGNGWNPNNDWWYFELKRQGTFEGGLRVMSVAIDY